MKKIGVIGLGIMGGAMARNLVSNGFDVHGHDKSPEAGKKFVGNGGTLHASVRDCVVACDTLLTSLPTASAFEQVMGEIADASDEKRVVIEVSTMSLALKEAARASLEKAGCTLLDCPVSGTGAQAATQDLVVFASGHREAYERILPVLEGMSRRRFYLGKFGSGTVMKFLANQLVAVHNAAAAEVFTVAEKAGIDLSTVFHTLEDSAATSRMFQVRGPQMVEGRYDRPTARISMFLKDLDLISEFAADLHCQTPLFDITTQMYRAASAAGHADLDTAAVIKVFESLSGMQR